MFDTKSTHRLGSDGFYWFYGVVEDIQDPLKLGRVRVRILGDHTQSKKDNRIPTERLPWAFPVSGIGSAAMNGIGISPLGLVNGSWVFGWYADGIDKQQPMILGSLGGIPEAICEKQDEVGFQDPEGIYPLGFHVFEPDTNRLARGVSSIEVPEKLVPEQEKECDDGKCPENGELCKQYIDQFDREYIEGKSKKSDDNQKQYKLQNNHPFTVYKFVKRERRIPIALPFADYAHRKEWHEPQNPYAAKYPYNVVKESPHKEGNDDVYAYDASDRGDHRKQKCGLGAWGIGEEWDSTPGNERYHRFHPSGNYFEIDKEGREVRKIYGDAFEIDIKDKSILIKGDWNITVEGNKNELIEGDYNLQVIGNINRDVRGNIMTHVDGDEKKHIKSRRRVYVDGNEELLVRGSRFSSVLVDDIYESQNAERHANKIKRYGAESIEDEGFMSYSLKAHEGNIDICNRHDKSKEYVLEVESMKRICGLFEEKSLLREQWIKDYTLHTDNYLILFGSSYEVKQEEFDCEECEKAGHIEFPEKVSYCETECINNQCKPRYNECIQAALADCMVTLKDPRTGKDVSRVDWEKYHTRLKECSEAYDKCVDSCNGCESTICAPSTTGADWSVQRQSGEKQIVKKECANKPQLIDPWENLNKEKP